jgi:hypothetical protein
MNKRLLTAAIGIALCAFAAPADAKRYTHDDDDDGGRSYRHRQYERSYDRDDDDDERSYRREQSRHQRANRQKTRAQAARSAPHEQAAKPPQVVAMTQPETAKPQLQPIIPPDAARPTPQANAATPQRQARNDGRGCLRSTARALLDRIEAQFGPMQLISTCRPGARIAGSGRISKHASGEAIDFNAGRRKGEVVRWLIANHKSGGTMTYAGMSHIHVDVGQHFVALNSGGGR